MIAFGDLRDDGTRALAIGRRIADALTLAGFEVSWDGTAETRINPFQRLTGRGDTREERAWP